MKLKTITILLCSYFFIFGCVTLFGEEEDYYDDSDSYEEEYDEYEFEDEEDEDFEEDGEYEDDAQDTEVDEWEKNSGNGIVISSLPASVPADFHDAFDKYVNVFGVHIYAAPGISEPDLMHVASVMAEYLDNDEDGTPDNSRLISTLNENDAVLFVFDKEREERNFDPPENMFGQAMFARDIAPGGAARGEFDATLEETLHLITSAGYHFAYPEIWGERPGTAVADAMDIARGGQFIDIPSQYPTDAWYTYDDETCEYNCMVSEYIYWALTSLLGGQDFPGRLDEIEHEWRFNTPEKIRTGDVAIVELLLNPEYGFPERLPDGTYQPAP
jgi:hypothetical protein